ncbi:hypothetical protein [Nocardia sp. NPDC046763]|uniref:hypothetical protein n=1 Tax=Nocardia sp. NPDC046763 TaxID=3155256 RepID=UPI0033F59B06
MDGVVSAADKDVAFRIGVGAPTARGLPKLSHEAAQSLPLLHFLFQIEVTVSSALFGCPVFGTRESYN